MLPQGRWGGLTAQQGEEFFGQLDGSTGGGGVERDRRRRGLDGSMGRQGEEGVGRINGLIGGRGVWIDQWFDGLTPRLAGRPDGNGSTVKA
jgi:hypothetical protein